MQITNCGRGVHKREVKGVGRFQSDLPAAWYGFTNLDLALGVARAREVDIVIISDRRIFVIDIKDWFGRITSGGGRWQLDGEDRDASPVAKINDIARDISILLKASLAKRTDSKELPVPFVIGLVVLTGKADRSGISPTEIAKVLTQDEFFATVANDRNERDTYGDVAPQIVTEPLTGPVWKHRLTQFFNAGSTSPFKHGRRNFQRYTAEDAASFSHPKDIYREYDAQEDGTPPNLGTLRVWDFTQVPDTRFQTEEGRREIAGRERQVYHWLRDRSESVERTLLTPRIDDPELSVNYWEIFDRRRRLKRLSDFAKTEVSQLGPSERVELARQLLAHLADMHRHGAAHLDLGSHCIWLEAPTTVRLSHLFAARFADVKSLGPARYQFLASVALPEDVLGNDQGPMRRDVFLVGAAVHQILFGTPPQGQPPEWNPSVDVSHTFTHLHDWFGEALDIDPQHRFLDARAALEAFNRGTVEHPTPEEVIAGLDSFRGSIRSQLSLSKAFPADGAPIRESDSLDAWRSIHEGKPALLKMWKQAAWGDLKKEGPRILAFLERARELAADMPAGVPPVRLVVWLGDAIGLVQDWAIGSELTAIISDPPEAWKSPEVPMTFTAKLITAIDRLHEAGHGHGDLKPDNIVVDQNGDVELIDFLDFSPQSDGAKQTSAYSPMSGTIFERDRFAITKIAEEVFGFVGFEAEDAAKLAQSISECRDKEPKLATLSPLKEAIGELQEALARPTEEQSGAISLSLSIRNAAVGPLQSDEGFFFLRAYPASTQGSATLYVRGATEEIEVRFDDRGNPSGAWRRQLGQTQIAIVARHEFLRLSAEIRVVRSDHSNFDDVERLLSIPTVRGRMQEAVAGRSSVASIVGEEGREPDISDEAAEEALAEELAAESGSADADLSIDVPLLWRTLIEIEKELTIEGVAEGGSSFDRTTRRHRVPFDLQIGSFDFDRNDTVGVQRQDRRGAWKRIGELDVRRSRSSHLMIEAASYGSSRHFQLVDAGQRLRFVSHFETESLRRRADAVDRILGGSRREANLSAVFDPRTHTEPSHIGHSVDKGEIKKTYNLNADQCKAFERIITARPVGLLQGPPGTGKTKFIAALAHYAITRNLARNVLLSSQSHEAVNTAGEALLSLFRKTGEDPSVLRVAVSDDQVSDAIRPFHTRPVEQAFKDRFAAEFLERQLIVGRALGINAGIVADIVDLEITIRPVVALIARLQTEEESTHLERLAGLRQSLVSHLERLQLSPELAADVGVHPDTFIDILFSQLLARISRSDLPSDDKVTHLRSAIKLGQDFIESASRIQRSFETFLAGTRQIVLGTCVGLGRTSLGLTRNAFDLVIVDEAARCTSSELLVPLQAARWVVLVGDQAQLEPHHEATVINRVAAITKIPKKEIQRSDFERVFRTKYASAAGARLTTQYRMLAPVGQVISEAFYPNLTLNPGRVDPVIPPGVLPAELSHPLTWVATDGLGESAFDRKKEEGGSRTNKVEVDAIVAMLTGWYAHAPFRTWMTEATDAPIAIGVICTYGAQRDLMHQHLLRSPIGHLLGKHVKVGTVDSYQGKENPIVILSLVRHNRDGSWEDGAKTIREGFLSSPNRVNVAASRGQDRLVIVGAHRRWRADGPLGHLVSAFSRQIESEAARLIEVEEILGLNDTSIGGKKRRSGSQTGKGGKE